jgi:hypothetical protein
MTFTPGAGLFPLDRYRRDCYMAVLAAHATDTAHKKADCSFKVCRQRAYFSRRRVEDRSQLTPQLLISRFPQLNGQCSLLTAIKDAGPDPRPRASRQRDQVVRGDDELVSAPDPQHLDADKLRRDHHRMAPIDRQRIDGLQPGNGLSCGVKERAVVSHIFHCPARLGTAQYIALLPSLVFECQESLAKNAPLLESAQR